MGALGRGFKQTRGSDWYVALNDFLSHRPVADKEKNGKTFHSTNCLKAVVKILLLLELIWGLFWPLRRICIMLSS